MCLSGQLSDLRVCVNELPQQPGGFPSNAVVAVRVSHLRKGELCEVASVGEHLPAWTVTRRQLLRYGTNVSRGPWGTSADLGLRLNSGRMLRLHGTGLPAWALATADLEFRVVAPDGAPRAHGALQGRRATLLTFHRRFRALGRRAQPVCLPPFTDTILAPLHCLAEGGAHCAACPPRMLRVTARVQEPGDDEGPRRTRVLSPERFRWEAPVAGLGHALCWTPPEGWCWRRGQQLRIVLQLVDAAGCAITTHFNVTMDYSSSLDSISSSPNSC